MKKIAVKLGACALSACMIPTIFAGCAQNNADPPAVTEAEATSVAYSENGEYTTKVTLDGADFSGLGANDVKVAYSILDEAGYNAAMNAASDKSTVKEADYEKATAAQVKNVSVNGDEMTVSFSDPDAAANRTDYYALYIESRQIGASVNVEFKDYRLTTETEYVPASATTIPLTLTLNDGQFAQNVAQTDITLSGAFEGLTIANIVSSDKNLTMQLAGEIKKHESSNAYLDGTVEIAAKAIKDAGEAERITIPVRARSAYLAGSEIEFQNGKGTVPLFLIDCGVDASTLTKESISFTKSNGEGGQTSADITVESLEHKGDSEVVLTLNVPDAASKNDVAKALSGVTVNVGDDLEFASAVTAAVFYPVFDYVEDDGANQNFILELYAYNGTFAHPLKKEMFELGDDFGGGQVISVKRTNDTVVELKISVPANGQTVDDLDKVGSVTAKAGALVNEWGEVADEACEYTRRYTEDGLGRDLSDTDIDSIKNIVGGFGNTTFGTITDVASGAVSGVDAVMTILDLTGIVPNKASQTLTLLKQVASDVQTILSLMNEQIKMLQELQADTYKNQLSKFDARLANLNDQNDKLATYYGYAKADLGIDPDDKNNPNPTAEDQKDESKMKALAKQIVDHCKEQEAAGVNKYLNFTTNFNELVSAYDDVAAMATLTDSNPMGVFDKLCTLTYNFDTSSYDARTAQRLDIEYALKEGLLNIALYYGCEFGDQEINPDLKTAKARFVAFEGLINTDTKNGKKQGDFAVVRKNVETSDFFKISDQYVYSYVLNLNLVKNLEGDYDTTAAVNTTATINDSKSGVNFSDDQKTEFVKRMQGRTMQEELILAGYYQKVIIKMFRYDAWSLGVAFKCWSDKDGAWSFWDARKFKHWYADVIKWDETTITSKVKTHYEWDDQNYDLVCLWHTSWVPQSA